MRDASFTLQALFNLGHLSETEGYLRWIERLLSEHGAARMQIMYGLRGEENLPEEELSHLDGYKGSRPVRIGNEAAKQRQLDIYGELLDSALKLSRYVGKVDSEIWPFLRGICNHVVDHWKDRDSGIWEVRGGPFLLCTFWLVDNLIALGRLDEAETFIRRIEGTANGLGLFSEEYDVVWKEALGNFPQAFTHIGYINSAVALRKAKEKGVEPEKEMPGLNILLADRIVLNDGESRYDIPPKEIAVNLKDSMNVLRGAFFDTAKGRVAYERMRRSEAYGQYLEMSYTLKKMALNFQKSRQEQIAFWINLYNVIVIHGVIELGIRDSVKEIRNFFRRVQYQIHDGMVAWLRGRLIITGPDGQAVLISLSISLPS
ncbi:trehalase [bacterium BMS3Abin10]|nr:trehalase [bacterium BMS3Abin10]